MSVSFIILESEGLLSLLPRSCWRWQRCRFIGDVETRHPFPVPRALTLAVAGFKAACAHCYWVFPVYQLHKYSLQPGQPTPTPRFRFNLPRVTALNLACRFSMLMFAGTCINQNGNRLPPNPACYQNLHKISVLYYFVFAIPGLHGDCRPVNDILQISTRPRDSKTESLLQIKMRSAVLLIPGMAL